MTRFVHSRQLLACFAAVVAGLCSWSILARGQGTSVTIGGRTASEYEVKAAFLLNFIRFVEWPPASTSSNEPFSICILGDDPFQRTLDLLVQTEKVNGRPITVRRISRWQPPCRLLFISASERDVFQTLQRVEPGVLTVGEEPGFLIDGGMINFIVAERRVQFDINLQTASKASVRISSRLVGVARRVMR